MPLYGKWVCLCPYMVPSFPPWVFGLTKADHTLLLAAFNNILAMSWRSVLLLEKTSNLLQVTETDFIT